MISSQEQLGFAYKIQAQDSFPSFNFDGESTSGLNRQVDCRSGNQDLQDRKISNHGCGSMDLRFPPMRNFSYHGKWDRWVRRDSPPINYSNNTATIKLYSE